jgi:hypothetical protein
MSTDSRYEIFHGLRIGRPALGVVNRQFFHTDEPVASQLNFNSGLVDQFTGCDPSKRIHRYKDVRLECPILGGLCLRNMCLWATEFADSSYVESITCGFREKRVIGQIAKGGGGLKGCQNPNARAISLIGTREREERIRRPPAIKTNSRGGTQFKDALCANISNQCCERASLRRYLCLHLPKKPIFSSNSSFAATASSSFF